MHNSWLVANNSSRLYTCDWTNCWQRVRLPHTLVTILNALPTPFIYLSRTRMWNGPGSSKSHYAISLDFKLSS